MPASLLVIACGAIARELVQLQRLNGWTHIEFQCLPAELHNTPDRITGAVEAMIIQEQDRYDDIFVGYADCGTGGLLDSMLDKYSIGRIPGSHCYEFFSGTDLFEQLADEEPGTFYLTDYLVHSFDRLIKEGLGINKHPQLKDTYFGNYRKVCYLAQTESETLRAQAQEHARYLGLDYEYRFCGLDPLNDVLKLNIPEQVTCQN